MIRSTKWLAVLLLALSTQACASLMLEEWANDRAPRSEVIGFIDGHGLGDALIVRLSGEPDCQDGVYAMPIVESLERRAELAAPAPMLLDASESKALQSMSARSPRVARLDCSQARHSPRLLAVDGYERVDGALRKIEIADLLYFVDVESQIEVAESSFTRVAAQAGHAANGDMEVRGVAYLPPARRVAGRFIPAIVAAPFALAFDIVTLPVQTVVGLVLMGQAFDRIFSGLLIPELYSVPAICTSAVACSMFLTLIATGHVIEPALLHRAFLELHASS